MKVILFPLLLLFTFNVSADHILSGEMYYNSTGNNEYEFNVI